jgi:hypothetical protein
MDARNFYSMRYRKSAWGLFFLLASCLSNVGCEPSSDEQASGYAAESGAPAEASGTADSSSRARTSSGLEALDSDRRPLRASRVPLRVGIIGRMDQSEILSRQWLSDSEQPIDVRVLSASEVLNGKTVPADVILYPSRLLGELSQRQWVVKLPVLLQKSPESLASGENDHSLNPLPGLLSATSYNGVRYGLPLGFSMVNLLGSAGTVAEQLSYDELLERLTILESGSEAVPEPESLDSTSSHVDAEALVDRFLAIAFGISSVNPKYGVLFEVRNLKARLLQEEFIIAANLLKKLASQKGGLQSVVGTHSQAWQWVHQCAFEAYVLASPSELDLEARELDSAHWIRLDQKRNWNSGAGMVVSLTSDCRQTAQAVRFLNWICQPRTIASLESNLQGVVSIGSGSRLADRVNQQNASFFGDYNLSCEPRLPRTHQYRAVLADELLSIVLGQKSAEDGLSAAAAAWDAISSERLETQQNEYEKSLGMTL